MRFDKPPVAPVDSDLPGPSRAPKRSAYLKRFSQELKKMALELTKLDESARKSRTPLEDIPADLIETIEEAYADSGGNPDSRYGTPSLGSKDDAEEWLHMARSYAWHRGQGDNAKGRIVVAGNSTKNGQVRFRVYDFVTE